MKALAGVAALEIGEATPPGRSVAKSKQSGPFYTTGRKPASDWNRPVRSRTQGGVGPATGWVNAQSVAGTRFSAFGLQVESIPESLPDTLEWFAIDRPNRSLHLVMLNRLEALNVRIALYPEERS